MQAPTVTYRLSNRGWHCVDAFVGTTRVGLLTWDAADGEINSIDVPESHRGKGIGRKMFEFAGQIDERLHHSSALTELGKVFAAAVQ